MTIADRRRFTIGGSEAAAACGVDPFCSPVMLWAYKTGRAEHPETQLDVTLERMAHVLESLALQADRYDAEIGRLRDDQRDLERYVSTLQDAVLALQHSAGHSVRVVP